MFAAALLLAVAPAASTAPSTALPAPVPARPARAAAEVTDADLRAAWGRLDAAQRADLIEWFRAESEWVGGFQRQLVTFVLESEERDPGTWPEAGDPPTYDPTVHAPAQPIQRRAMKSAAAAERAREHWLANVPKRRLRSAWVYDYASRDVQRLPNADDPERIFENAIAGFLPNHDLAEALVERALDDGAQRAALTAFGHAYSDRNGNVVPGLTLYDVWCSGQEMEMPDVECLGVLHDLEDDWRTFKAPVPERLHRKLYKTIGELFLPAHRHRGLRNAMARSYLTGTPVLRDGYQESIDRLHSVWEQNTSTPSRLRDALPESKDWESYLEDLAKACRKDKALRESGEVRRATLDADAQRVRALMIRLMREAEYLPSDDETK